MTVANPLLPADDFADLAGGSYLYTAAQAPGLRGALAAFEGAYRAQGQGPRGRLEQYRHESEARAALATLSGATEENIALVGDASTAWNLVANGLSWKPGDNVVLNEFEHPSVVFPFLRLARKGLQVRIAPRTENWEMGPEQLRALCDERTRAIAFSDVSYVNSYRHDLNAIADFAEPLGIPLLVDYSHSLGVLPVDLTRVAIGISASYKWLLGPYGVGILFWNPDRLPDFRPGGTGWRSTTDFFTEDRFERYQLEADASRFRQGASSFAGAAALSASIHQLLGLGLDTVAAHSSALATEFRAGLVERGLTVITPADPARRGGSIAWLTDPGTDAEALATELAERGCLLWGGDGRLRASFHVMNSSRDVENALANIEAVGQLNQAIGASR